MKDYALETVEDDSSEFIEEESLKDKDDNESVVGQGETRAVSCLRWVVFGVLMLVALLVCVGVYVYGRLSEIAVFESQFQAHAIRVLDAFEIGAKRRLKSIQTLSVAYTAHAQATNQSWPFVTMNDFEIQAGMVVDLADVASVLEMPLVADDETRQKWINYSQHNQWWLWEGLLVQADYNVTKLDESLQGDISALEALIDDDDGVDDDDDALYSDSGVSVEILKLEEGSNPVLEDRPGPWFPIWQCAPAIPFPQLINVNTWEIETAYMLEHQEAFISYSFDPQGDNPDAPTEDGADAILELFLRRQHDSYEGGPVSNLFFPIFESNHEGEEKVLVGILNAYVYWELYFEDVLPEKSYGVIVVLENTQNQTYTFELNGPEVTYIGIGDSHDEKYDYLEEKTEFGSYIGSFGDKTPVEERLSAYRIRVYASSRMRSEYLTDLPMEMSIVLAITFLVTSFVFLTYDCVVERRQKIVLTEAIKTGKVVQSLFPDNVRDRLYDNEAATKDEKKRAYLNPMSALTSNTGTNNGDGSKPIADLYPNCTVLFADIKGFTKWSSQREPADVFTLLETIYGSFDKSAKRLSVCKIETIGDCYLAVTGLPHPQDDHAERMARFAVLLNTKMNQIAHQLVSDLGSDTVELQMRVGLHSGPVTAGVLRGEKARFQLFGDTVNTASRMESTGEGGKIQMSQETADLLVDAGKANWVEPRDTLVEAKGKGSLQTFWLKKDLFSIHETTSITTSSTMMHDGSMAQDNSWYQTSRKGSMMSMEESSTSFPENYGFGSSVLSSGNRQEQAPATRRIEYTEMLTLGDNSQSLTDLSNRSVAV